MKILPVLTSGVTGAVAVTLMNEVGRRLFPEAPRLDLLGMRAVAQLMEKADQTPPEEGQLRSIAMAGDIMANTVYYSLIGIGNPSRSWLRGTILGLLAGIGGVFLPDKMGLGSKPSARTRSTAAMTIGWYLLGGLASAAAFDKLTKKLSPDNN